VLVLLAADSVASYASMQELKQTFLFIKDQISGHDLDSLRTILHFSSKKKILHFYVQFHER
jgi:hypothetical protein